MVKTKTSQTLAQQLRPLLGLAFDVLDDNELENCREGHMAIERGLVAKARCGCS